jgi:hypothetical protein
MKKMSWGRSFVVIGLPLIAVAVILGRVLGSVG